MLIVKNYYDKTWCQCNTKIAGLTEILAGQINIHWFYYSFTPLQILEDQSSFFSPNVFCYKNDYYEFAQFAGASCAAKATYHGVLAVSCRSVVG